MISEIIFLHEPNDVTFLCVWPDIVEEGWKYTYWTKNIISLEH